MSDLNKKYVGTKEVYARLMNRQDYIDYRGWQLPEDEDGNDEGYLIEYIDGGKPNDERHKGYISWSPKDVFEKSYHTVDTTPKDRLIVEQFELSKKIESLNSFLKKSKPSFIDQDHWDLLNEQYSIMKSYDALLIKRLSLFD